MKNYLSNMFANIQNGQLANKKVIKQPRKKICESFLKVLWSEGFICGYTVEKSDSMVLNIYLKYRNNRPVISSIKSLSTSSRKINYSAKQIWKINPNKYFIIFSTNKGMQSIGNCKKLKIGGQPCIIIN